MNKTNDKKVCSFFVSDYHFEMITLPYIEKEIENNKKIIILTDKDLIQPICNTQGSFNSLKESIL